MVGSMFQRGCPDQGHPRCLKDLCEICGFNTPHTITYYKNNVRHDEVKPKYELIGTHAGRKTFICFALSNGIPPDVVMKFTGTATTNP